MKWYALSVLPSREKAVVEEITSEAAKLGLSEYFDEFFVPSFPKMSTRRGKAVTIETRLMPGYVFVKMISNAASWAVIKNADGVAKVLGHSEKGLEISEVEINRIRSQVENKKKDDGASMQFNAGMMVKIIDGPFENFVGNIEEVDRERKRLKLLVYFWKGNSC